MANCFRANKPNRLAPNIIRDCVKRAATEKRKTKSTKMKEITSWPISDLES